MARRHRPSTPATSKGPPQEPSGRKGAQRESWQPPGPAPAAAPPLARWEWLLLAALVLSIFFVYQPAWQGGFIWDDDAHVTKPELRSWQGLYRIWFDVRATVQYYPLLHSAFWIEHKLWGDATLGYHLLNLLLHAAAAVLAALILRRLAIPGAYLAAAIFALHPVHAESVAWITEQKNTLSAVFYLGAMLVYLRFDQTRKLALYGWALGLFLLAILSKTVTATLPGGLLVIFWWQRGRLSWKRDVLPLLPLFLLGAGGGLVTAWWELQVNHCVGPEFQFTPVERLLIAGRAVWFHLWKLCWPTRLTFFYPRWQIDSGAWWQYLFPLGLTALLVGLWSIRGRTRAPLAALLFFGGTLFPVLGFFNLYTFRYSLIANHYQYLASLGAITLAAAGVVWLLERWGLWRRPAGYMVCLALLATLAGLSWRQSRMYIDHETLYRTTIEENPDCWIAQSNLGVALARRGQLDKAIAHYHKALELKPDYAEAHYNLGGALSVGGKIDDAVAQYQEALKIQPDYAAAHGNLGNLLAAQNNLDEAVRHYLVALRLDPRSVPGHTQLGRVLSRQGKPQEAEVQFREALRQEPSNVEACSALAMALQQQGRTAEASATIKSRYDCGQIKRTSSITSPGFAPPIQTPGSATARRPWPVLNAPSSYHGAKCTRWIRWPPPTRKRDGFRKPWPRRTKPCNWPGKKTSKLWPMPCGRGSSCTKREGLSMSRHRSLPVMGRRAGELRSQTPANADSLKGPQKSRARTSRYPRTHRHPHRDRFLCLVPGNAVPEHAAKLINMTCRDKLAIAAGRDLLVPWLIAEHFQHL